MPPRATLLYLGSAPTGSWPIDAGVGSPSFPGSVLERSRMERHSRGLGSPYVAEGRKGPLHAFRVGMQPR
eukprot:10675423-Alexandrium_andersonii.AAC.1